jgi:hypothetical protein
MRAHSVVTKADRASETKLNPSIAGEKQKALGSNVFSGSEPREILFERWPFVSYKQASLHMSG